MPAGNVRAHGSGSSASRWCCSWSSARPRAPRISSSAAMRARPIRELAAHRRASLTSTMPRPAARRLRSRCRACSRICRARDFKVDEADRYTNLLDALAKAGFDVEWRDNNAGCKGVCARVDQLSTIRSDRTRRSCPNSYCYDEVMLEDLADAPGNDRSATRVIVFHAIGSHGPAYSERYPPQFETFQAGLPFQRAAALQRSRKSSTPTTTRSPTPITSWPGRSSCCARTPASARQRADLCVRPRRVAGREGHLSARHAVRLCAARAEGSADAVLGFATAMRSARGLQHGLRARALARCRSATTTSITPCWARPGVRDAVYDRGLDLLARCRRDAGPIAGDSERSRLILSPIGVLYAVSHVFDRP